MFRKDSTAEAKERDRRIAEAAQRATQEAQERRRAEERRREEARASAQADAPTEIGGRDGPEPTRFGDWEKNGIVSDF